MLITNKEELVKFRSSERKWQGIPSVEVSAGGRVFVSFYSGNETETMGNYACLTVSEDGGANFGEPIAVAYLGENARAFDSCLWIDPLGRLWFFWAVMPENRVEFSICDNPDAEVLVWSDIRTIPGEVMLNKPTVLSDGSWIFPVAVWRYGLFPKHPGIKGRKTGAYAVISRDCGNSFEVAGNLEVESRSFDEHMFLEKKDGALEVYLRTFYGIAVSRSFDGGYSWSEDTDSRLGGPDSRFFIRRLKSGNILLINHYKFFGRNNLTAMISDDDGEHYKGFLRIDGRNEVSYPDAIEHNGKIYIVHDRERGAKENPAIDYTNYAREILISVVSEKEILAGAVSEPDSFLCGIVSKLKIKA